MEVTLAEQKQGPVQLMKRILDEQGGMQLLQSPQRRRLPLRMTHEEVPWLGSQEDEPFEYGDRLNLDPQEDQFAPTFEVERMTPYGGHGAQCPLLVSLKLTFSISPL
jgi:hypothetical protein